MILSRRVSLGGVQLDEIHEAIVIQGIDTGVPSESFETTTRMGGYGTRLTSSHVDELGVSVRFGIDVRNTDVPLRRQIWESVMTWALARGWLTISDMPDRRLYVDKVTLPGSGDLRKWTESFTITFTAYNVPFWQTMNPTLVTAEKFTTGSRVITVGGNAPGVLDIIFENQSGKTIADFQVSAGGNTLTLSGVNLAAAGTLQITHGNDGLLRITANNTSVLNKRTGSDDLYVKPGNVTVNVTASRAGRLTIRNYGRYY